MSVRLKNQYEKDIHQTKGYVSERTKLPTIYIKLLKDVTSQNLQRLKRTMAHSFVKEH